ADRHACSGQPPPACCAICNSSFQLALSRLLKPGGCGGFRSLMIRTLSEAHRASLRRIVENSGSSAYAKSSVFSSGFLGHILRIILRLAIVRGNLVLPRMPRIFGQNGSYQRPSRGILVPRLQPAFTNRPEVGLSVKQIIGLIDDQGWAFAINCTVYAGTSRFDANERFRHQKT